MSVRWEERREKERSAKVISQQQKNSRWLDSQLFTKTSSEVFANFSFQSRLQSSSYNESVGIFLGKLICACRFSFAKWKVSSNRLDYFFLTRGNKSLNIFHCERATWPQWQPAATAWLQYLTSTRRKSSVAIKNASWTVDKLSEASLKYLSWNTSFFLSSRVYAIKIGGEHRKTWKRLGRNQTFLVNETVRCFFSAKFHVLNTCQFSHISVELEDRSFRDTFIDWEKARHAAFESKSNGRKINAREFPSARGLLIPYQAKPKSHRGNELINIEVPTHSLDRSTARRPEIFKLIKGTRVEHEK